MPGDCGGERYRHHARRWGAQKPTPRRMDAGYHDALRSGRLAGRAVQATRRPTRPGRLAGLAVQATRRPSFSGLARGVGTNLVDATPGIFMTGSCPPESCATLSGADANASINAPATTPRIRIDLLVIISSLGPNVPRFVARTWPTCSEIQSSNVTNIGRSPMERG
jgi:hypothetical protein